MAWFYSSRQETIYQVISHSTSHEKFGIQVFYEALLKTEKFKNCCKGDCLQKDLGNIFKDLTPYKFSKVNLTMSKSQWFGNQSFNFLSFFCSPCPRISPNVNK